jgi:hypothetical protein
MKKYLVNTLLNIIHEVSEIGGEVDRTDFIRADGSKGCVFGKEWKTMHADNEEDIKNHLRKHREYYCRINGYSTLEL